MEIRSKHFVFRKHSRRTWTYAYKYTIYILSVTIGFKPIFIDLKADPDTKVKKFLFIKIAKRSK